MLTKKIYVTFRKEGIHAYYDALTNPSLADVSFLGYPHRHLFGFKVIIDVFHDDREIEFIQFKRWLESLYSDKILDLMHKSCEMIASELIDTIKLRYPNRNVSVEVNEDGENGCILDWKY